MNILGTVLAALLGGAAVREIEKKMKNRNRVECKEEADWSSNTRESSLNILKIAKYIKRHLFCESHYHEIK